MTSPNNPIELAELIAKGFGSQVDGCGWQSDVDWDALANDLAKVAGDYYAQQLAEKDELLEDANERALGAHQSWRSLMDANNEQDSIAVKRAIEAEERAEKAEAANEFYKAQTQLAQKRNDEYAAESARLRQALEEIKQAIRVKGPVPKFHKDTMKRHRKEWPTLWKAIDKATAALEDGKK